MLICLIPVISQKAISITTGAVLVFAGLLFAASSLDIRYKSRLGEFELGHKAEQFEVQFAKLNKAIQDLKPGSPEAKEAASSCDLLQTPVVIYYVSRQQLLAQQIFEYLIGCGSAAATFEDDFSQLSPGNRPPQGTVRIVHTDATAQAAVKLKEQLTKKFSKQVEPVQFYLNSELTAAKLQIQIF